MKVKTVVFLVGLYICCQMIADVGATKLVQIGDYVIPGGTFVFTLTFTLRDLIHKRLGREWARWSIVVAAVCNVVMAFYLSSVSRLSSPVFYELNDAWQAIFSIVPAITIASIVAEFISELLDTEVYQLWKSRFSSYPQWTRVIASNAVSLPVDSLVFGLLAFVVLPPVFGAESLPVVAALSIVSGQILFKALVTVISLPAIYLVDESNGVEYA
jgi:uncharacterized integral membrane protein (TIGR00697 family)